MLKLTFEFVPEECWYSNLRSVLEQEEWDVVRRDAYKKAGYRCEICGEKSRLEAHEKWSYDDTKALQKLEGIIALCNKCHLVKHISRSYLVGKGQYAMEQYMKVNHCSQAEFHAHLSKANERYAAQNKIEGWVTDLTWLKEKYGFTPKFR